MNSHLHRSIPPLTRRDLLHGSMTIAAGLAFGMTPLRAVTASQTSNPADRGYAHPESLIDFVALRNIMDTDEQLVLVGFMPADGFASAHIPGSVQLDWPTLEVIDTSDASIESWQRSVAELLGELGITPKSTVVAYDNGTLLSARLWWILHYFGHENVHILDGGLPAWATAGMEIESGGTTVPGGPAYASTPNLDLLAQRDEVLGAVTLAERANKLASDPSAFSLHPDLVIATLQQVPVIVDARAPEEYVEGCIPGAVNLNFPLNAEAKAPKFYKPAAELQAMYDEIGVASDRMVIPYCASGVRSAVTAFALHLLGYENVALYTGSWLEWGEDPSTPKAQGGTR